MKTAVIRISALVAAAIMSLVCIAAPCCAATGEQHRTVRVGWYDTGDENNIGSDSLGMHGYDYEYLQALAQYSGWEYEYVNGTWDDCLTWLENGQIDLLAFAHKTQEREKVFGYPTLPMATTSGYLVTGSQGSIHGTDMTSLNGSKVGIVKGNGYNSDFREYCEKNGYDVTYVEYNSLTDISPALESGEIDAAVVAEEDKTENERIVDKFASYNQFFITNIANTELLDELNDAMKLVNTYCPSLNNDLYQKYFGVNTEGKPVFTAGELEFIKNNPDILVLYDAGWPPVEYLDEESGTYKGISPDLFALLKEKCGINFVYESSTSGQVLSQLKNGEKNNALTTISYDYAWADRHDVYITQPFITSTIVKLGKNLDEENPTVAINEKAYFAFLLKDELEGVYTRNYAKQSERLEAVRTGEADYTFVTEDQANYYRSIPKYSDLKVERMVGYEQKICISIEKNASPELISIISKAIASITHDEMTEIIRKNTVDAYKLTFGDMVYKYRRAIAIVALLIAVVAASLTVVLIVKRRSAEKIKEAYELEKQALIVANKASAAKGNFMSRMSHEIRTPLNAVIGYNTIARNEMTGARNEQERRQSEMKVMDCLTKSDIASKHLLTIINDVLDMSAIESGKIKVSHEKFDFKGLITSLTTIFYTQAKTKDIDFDVIFNSNVEEWFVGDQMRTNQILTNLLSNAVKFTSEGGSVRLEITQIPSDDKLAHIHFEVSDTGIGMTKDYLEHIWTPFEQADSSISRRFGGTGLGLSITKNLVDIMGGAITVESRPGVGTKFDVDLKFETSPQPVNSANYDFSGINALVADDDMSTCDYIRLLFNRCGARCATVTTGMDAVAAFEKSEQSGDRFTVCLIDWRMPKMDGIETIKRIREIAGDDLPIIVITAYDYSELADKAAEVGVNMFISKPLFQSSLFNLLETISGRKPQKEVVKSKDYNFKGAQIILAEDNEMNMEIARKILESAGIEVTGAWNGQEAIDIFEASPAGTYTAILMDVQMPVVDGHEATKAIRQSTHPDATTIPIIAMTADAFAENVAQALSSGMNDHIAKPIDVTTLFDKLQKYADGRQK